MTVDIAPREDRAFDRALPTPAGHFDLYVFAALLRLREQLPGIDDPDGAAAFPFLHAYFDQLPDWARDVPAREGWRRWCVEIESFERAVAGHLPLRALRKDAALDHFDLTLLFCAGLVDEDSRFGALFEALQPEGRRRPTVGLLSGWAGNPGDRRVARTAVARLIRLGLLRSVAADPAVTDPAARPATALWDVLRGDVRDDLIPWARHFPAEDAAPLSTLVLPVDVCRATEALPDLIRAGTVRTVAVRGPRSSGRRTLIAALARMLGYGRIELDASSLDAAAWLELGPLATALHAIPIVRLEPAIGETADLPSITAFAGPIALTLPAHGGASGPDLDRSVTLRLTVPTPAERRRHWVASLGGRPIEDLQRIIDAYRLSGGTIRRVATMAASTARLDGRIEIRAEDVQDASRTLRSRALETLAPLLPTSGSWDDLVTDDETQIELALLEERCRGRERLIEVLSPAVGLHSAGVRVLFTGPSGTGKTLAARLLAAVLGMDLHALQLSTVVDKYLGETEKNLTAVFARAAELDAILLLDEGDALLTRRTEVATSNDRYANLQTNHLLQQLEAHDGIVVITTNAGDRIDSAFQRRIDVVVEFRPPDAGQRWRLWRHHLPADHEVDDDTLAEIASRCQLTGGQIRNAVLHAWLLAMDVSADAVPSTRDVEAAVRREYRKMGTICPLRLD